MKNWAYKFDVNRFVRTGDPDKFKEIAANIVEGLEGQPPFNDKFGRKVIDSLKEAKSIDEFDVAMDSVYQFADRHSAWLGF